MLDLRAAFAANSAEYCKFERVENKLHRRPDICAFLLLDQLLPAPGADSDMVRGADHDVIYLDADLDTLAAVATEADVKTLLRCGVRYSSEGWLEMFT